MARATPADVLIDFGPTIPVDITTEALDILARLPSQPLARVLTALRSWAATTPLVAARGAVVSDPESASWQEVVLELRMKCDTEQALALWDEMETAIGSAMQTITADERALLERDFAIHLLWGADAWNDESVATI